MGSDSCQTSEKYTYLYEAICVLNLNLYMINNSSVCHKEQGRSFGNINKVFLTGLKESQSMPFLCCCNKHCFCVSKQAYLLDVLE